MATHYHFSPTIGAWTKCQAVNRHGQGVSFCPNFTEGFEGVEGTHLEGIASIAAMGGGQIHRNGRLTTIIPNVDGSYTAKTGKLTRVYNSNGELIPLRKRLQEGWEAQEISNAENKVVKALIKNGAYEPEQITRLSGVASLDKLRRMDKYEWANTSSEEKAKLISKALKDVATRYEVGNYAYSDEGLFQSMNVTGQTTFYVDKGRAPVIALSEALTTSLSNSTASDAIARQVAHLIVGRSAGHNPTWQNKVKELRKEMGLDAQGNPTDEPHRRTPFEQEQVKLYAKNLPFIAKCATGKHEFYRKDLDNAGDLCANCYRESGTRRAEVPITWEDNENTGKWQLTKDGFKVVEPVVEKTRRGPKLKDWRKLPEISTREDTREAMKIMSDELKWKLHAASGWYVSGWHGSRSRKNPLTEEANLKGSWAAQGYLNAGVPFKQTQLDAFSKVIDEKLARSNYFNGPDADSRFKEEMDGWVKVKKAFDSYKPDPELLQFVKALHDRLESNNR